MRFSPTLLLAGLGLAASASAQQELYVHGADGIIYRVDNYATAPTPVMIGAPDFGPDIPTDIAYDLASGDYIFTTALNGGISGRANYRVDGTTFAVTDFGGFGLFPFNSLDSSTDGRLFGFGSTFFYLAAFDRLTGREYEITSGFVAGPAGDLATDLDGSLIFTDRTGTSPATTRPWASRRTSAPTVSVPTPTAWRSTPTGPCT